MYYYKLTTPEFLCSKVPEVDRFAKKGPVISMGGDLAHIYAQLYIIHFKDKNKKKEQMWIATKHGESSYERGVHAILWEPYYHRIFDRSASKFFSKTESE